MYQGNSDSFRDLQRDYFSYSAGVNIGRALPDVRDGLKPVHRRILWSMRNLKGAVKSTAVVGDTLKIHPHGDSSVYGALVLMTDSRESWNVPLVKGQGTFGKVYSTLDAADHRIPAPLTCLGTWTTCLTSPLSPVRVLSLKFFRPVTRSC